MTTVKVRDQDLVRGKTAPRVQQGPRLLQVGDRYVVPGVEDQEWTVLAVSHGSASVKGRANRRREFVARDEETGEQTKAVSFPETTAVVQVTRSTAGVRLLPREEA